MQRNSTSYEINRQVSLVKIRNLVLCFKYKYFLKPILFLFDPETIHDLFIFIGKSLGNAEFSRNMTSLLFNYSNPILEQRILGINFKNPVGLAAGFDKDASLMNILPDVGFGFEEIGSITARPYSGNPKPRLTRLKKSRALIVNYGLKSDGALKIQRKLIGKKFRFPIGTSIAKTNSLNTVNEDSGVKDYVEGFKYFTKIGDYYTINVSCPNTFGGQPFHNPKLLNKLLSKLDQVKTGKPVFLKISPDLDFKQIDQLIGVCNKHRVHGFVLSNLTKKRDNKKLLDNYVPEKGGISGRVVQDLTDNLIAYVYKKTKGRYIIIGCGGIFSARDAYRKIKLGASLVQVITGMIFEGPQLISEINLELAEMLKKEGYKNISHAIGAGNR